MWCHMAYDMVHSLCINLGKKAWKLTISHHMASDMVAYDLPTKRQKDKPGKCPCSFKFEKSVNDRFRLICGKNANSRLAKLNP